MRRALRIGAWTLGAMWLLIVLLAGGVLVAGNTTGGRILIERTVARLAHDRMRLTGLSGSFPVAIDLARLQLSDDHGVWLTAEHISLRWSPLALLARHIEVEHLQIGRLDIERRPITAPSRSSTGTRVPRLDLDRLSINALELGPELAGVHATLAIRAIVHARSLTDTDVSLTARRIDAPGDYRVSLHADPARVAAHLGLKEHAGGALANLLRLPDLGELSVEAKLTGPRSAARLHVAGMAGSLSALAQGTLDLDRAAADLDFGVHAAAMAPAATLAWDRLSLQGRWNGTLTAPQADAGLELEGLRLASATGVRSLSAQLNAAGGVLGVHAVAEGLVVPGREPRVLSEAPLRIEARARLDAASRPIELTVDHRLFALAAQAVLRPPLRATFNLRLPDLAPLAAVAGEKLHGKAQLHGTFEGSSTDTRLDLEAATEVANDETLISRMLAGSSHLHLTGALKEHTLELQRLTLQGPILSLAASGSARRGEPDAAHALESLQARCEAHIANLGVLSPALSGTLTLRGAADGPATSFAGELQLVSSLSIRGSPRGTIEASLRARGLPSLASASVEARGDLAGAPLRLDASLERVAGDAFHLGVRRAGWKSVQVNGDLTTAADMTAGHGGLRLTIARLEDLDALLGTNLRGRIAGNLALRPVGKGTYMHLALDAENLVAAGVPAEARLTGSGTLDSTNLRLTLRSANLRGKPASLESAAHLNLSAHVLQLERLEARYQAQALRLLAPSRISFADGVGVSDMKFGMQHAVLELQGNLSPLDLHAAAHRIDASLVNAFVPGVLAQGSLNVEARVAGTTSAPSGLVTLDVSQLRLSAGRDLPALDAHATARLAGGSAQLDVHVAGGKDSRVSLTGTAPLGKEGALDLKVKGKLDAAFADPLLEARGDRLSGAVSIDATVNGALKSPEVQGSMDLAHGDFRDYVQGAHLSNIAAHLTAQQGNLKLESLTAHAGPGELTLTGEVSLTQPNLPISGRLTAKHAQPVTSDILNASLDADVKVEGSARERVDVSGTITVNRAVIGIPNALPPQVAVLDVRRPGQAPPAPPARELVIGLDLALHAPREIRVQGRGLNAELGGNLHIGGTTASPTVSGGFDMVRGTFALASTRLDFTHGRVSFSGTGLAGKLDPTLDFTAQATVTDSTVMLHITGLADSPQFELSSTPPLPQDEILARLLFGESASQLSALQLAQIGAALASLSGVGGSGPNPLVRVQKALGLDVLSVESGSNGGTQGAQSTGTILEAGRYVSNRVFVAARQSTTGFSQVEVDVDLSKHLKLQTRLGNGTATTQGITPENDPGSSVGMVYQFQY